MMANTNIIQTSGKRRRSIARVRIMESEHSGVRVNNKAIMAIDNEFARIRMLEPITLLGDLYKNNLSIKIRVHGGGWLGQADAVRIGIARALNKYFQSAEVTAIYNNYDRTLLSGDVRRKESKKAGGPSARARFQKSYR